MSCCFDALAMKVGPSGLARRGIAERAMGEARPLTRHCRVAVANARRVALGRESREAACPRP